MGKYIYFVCLIFAVQTVLSQSSKNCLTPSNLNGVCININLCQSLQTLYKNELQNSSVVSILRDSICGYELKQYKVCCPLTGDMISKTTPASSPTLNTNKQNNVINKNSDNSVCITPNQFNGTCINIRRCELLDSMYNKSIKNESTVNYLSKSFCGYEGAYPKVCCPLNSNYETVWSPNLPSSSTCGNTAPKDKVVGGQPAELGAWPWIAAIGYKHANKSLPINDYQWLCGGTLISDRYVLTAAHCTTGSGLNNRKLDVVRLGELNLDPTIHDNAKPINYEVARIIRHAKYKTQNITNDIALLKLKNIVVFTEFIQPICLPILSKMREHKLVKFYPYVAGWGVLEFSGPTTTALMEVQIPVKDNEICKQLYVNQTNVIIDDRVLCAGEGGRDSCQGDSGGPLMWPKGPQYYLVGIVSFGVGCGDDNYPGVYTRVSYFIEWIIDNMNSS